MTELTITSLYHKKLTVRPPSTSGTRHAGSFQVDMAEPDGKFAAIRGALYTKEDAIKLIAALEDICGITRDDVDPTTYVTKKTLVQKTFDFPQGCDDQKRAFLRTFGIDDPDAFLPKPHTIVLEAQYRQGHDHKEGLNCANFDGAPLGLSNAYTVIELGNGKDSWSKVKFTIKDASKLIDAVGFAPFEVKDGGYVWLRGQLKLDGIR